MPFVMQLRGSNTYLMSPENWAEDFQFWPTSNDITKAHHFASRAEAKELANKFPQSSVHDYKITPFGKEEIYKHPHRYPNHKDSDKGQRFGGACNTTRCDRENATFWNRLTYGFYCSVCAEGINRGNEISFVVEVGDNLSRQEMDRLNTEAMGAL